MNELYKLSNYTIDVNYIISTYIREYDISKANINVLYKYNVISKETYDRLYLSDRDSRQKEVGLMILKDNKIYSILETGIIEAKRMFFQVNNIQEQDVLAIKNDAVFIINKIPTITKFDNIEFVNKNIYTSFYKLNTGIELYYYFDVVANIERLDVKGIGDKTLKLHEDYFIEFLKVCFNSAQVDNIRDTLDIMTTFYTKYIQLQVDVGYYRTFDPASVYTLKKLSDYNTYIAEYIQDTNKNDIDISYNLNIMRQLYQIYSGLYFSRRRR